MWSLCSKAYIGLHAYKTSVLHVEFLFILFSGLYEIYLCNDSYSSLLICRLSLSTGCPRTKPYNVVIVFKSL